MSIRETILAVNDAKLTPLAIEEWGVTVYLRTWTGLERARFQRWWSSAEKKPDQFEELYGRVAVLSCADQGGNKLFSEEDIPALLGKSAAVLERITLESLKANGVSREAVDQAKKN